MGLNDKIVNSNIFMDGELEQKSNMYILHNTFSKRKPLHGFRHTLPYVQILHILRITTILVKINTHILRVHSLKEYAML